jgi:hypothetical protein
VLAALAGAGFLIAVFPPETILDVINATTFNGLAVLAPPVIGGLYWKKGNRFGAAASIITGEGGTILFFFGILNLPGMMPVMVLIPVCTAVYIIVSLVTGRGNRENPESVFPVNKRKGILWGGVFALLLAAGTDFWNWNRTPELFGGLPRWVWYFFGLGILLSAVFGLYSKSRKD